MAGHRPGALHVGEVAGPPTGSPAHLHPGGVAPPASGYNTAPVAETSRTTQYDTHHEETGGVVHKSRDGKAGKAVNGLARTLLLLTQLLTFLAFCTVLGGLAALQHRRNDLTLTGLQRESYTETFQSGNQVPYVDSDNDQFSFQWYILAVEIFVTLLILAMVCLPMRALQRLKPYAMCILTYAFVLTTLQIQSLLFFHRNRFARGLYGDGRIKTTLAGAIAGAVCNAFTLLFLSLLREPRKHDEYVQAGSGKRVGPDHV